MAINDNTVRWKVKKIGTGQVAVMSGATSSNAGTPGLVPSAPAGKQNDVLHGDGSWRSVAGKMVGFEIVEEINENADDQSISLSKLNVNNGKTSGARMVFTENLIEVYDENNVVRVRLGVFEE